MTCPELAVLTAWIEGADLPGVDEHLETCERCRAIVEARALPEPVLVEALVLTDDERAYLAAADLPGRWGARAPAPGFDRWWLLVAALLVGGTLAVAWLASAMVSSAMGLIGLVFGDLLLWDLAARAGWSALATLASTAASPLLPAMPALAAFTAAALGIVLATRPGPTFSNGLNRGGFR